MQMASPAKLALGAFAGILPGSTSDTQEQAQTAAPMAKAVAIERKPTIFYPIGWLAILAVAVWFGWLAMG